jgi:hypothetical protein
VIDDPLRPSGGSRDTGDQSASDRRGFAIVFVLAVAMISLLIGIDSVNKNRSPNANGSSAEPKPSGSSDPTGTGSTPNDPVTTTAPAAETSTTFAPNVVTIVGRVNAVAANGDLALNDGNADYTISMQVSPKVTNLGGAEVSKDLIQVGGQVQVTGLLTGSTIDAQTVIIPIQ